MEANTRSRTELQGHSPSAVVRSVSMTVGTDKLALGNLVQYLPLALLSRCHVADIGYLKELFCAWKVIPIHPPRRMIQITVGTLLSCLQGLKPFACCEAILSALF